MPGDQVLVLMPVIGSPLQARYSAPHTVMEKLSDQNYIVATPGCRTRKQLCHVNLLKPYFPCAEDGSSQKLGPPGVSPACVVTSVSPQVGAGLEEEDMPGPDEAMLFGRLKNSDSLQNLNVLLGHLDLAKKAQLIDLINKYCVIFGDTQTQTHLMEHEIDGGDAKPIRQRLMGPPREATIFLMRKFTICWKMGLQNPLIPVGPPFVC